MVSEDLRRQQDRWHRHYENGPLGVVVCRSARLLRLGIWPLHDRVIVVLEHGASQARRTDRTRPDVLRTVVETDDEPFLRDVETGATYSYVLLTLQRRGGPLIVGAVALAPGSEPLESIERTYLEEVARGIYDAGDMQTVQLERVERAG